MNPGKKITGIFGKFFRKRKNLINLFVSVLTLFIAFNVNPVFPQLETANWYFGIHSGITFNTSDHNPVFLQGNPMTKDLSAIVSDSLGNLLFFSDRVNVWNRKCEIMPNGNLFPECIGGKYPLIIVPDPGNTSQYYLFYRFGGGYNGGIKDTLFYSIINMDADSGLGDILIKGSSIN
jgi:hypothetical protein